jgi:hypothetical protein
MMKAALLTGLSRDPGCDEGRRQGSGPVRHRLAPAAAGRGCLAGAIISPAARGFCRVR